MTKSNKLNSRFAAGLLAVFTSWVLAPNPAHAAKDNGGSSCDNLVQNGANDCYMWTPPVTSTAVAIDGLNTAGEWTGVLAKTATGSLSGSHTIQIRHVKSGVTDTLNLFVTVSDPTFSADDNIQVYFDPLHNDGPPSPDSSDNVQFKIYRGSDNGAHQAHQPRRITATDDPWTPTTGAFAINSTASAWTVEIRLDPTELGVSNLNSTVGFGIVLNDFDSGNAALWPLNFAPATLFTKWSALKNRLPIDYVLSLDYSGSMTLLDGLTEDRWKRAVRAADMFVAVAGLFRQPDYFDDRVGSSRYAWDCFNDGAGDTTAQFPSGSGGGSGQLGSFPPSGTDLFAPHVAPDPPGNNCTPIRRGLRFALSQFTASTVATDREKLVVLLSDGFHNMPSADATFNTAPATYFTAGELSTYKVRTVSMGPDMTAGTALLAAIAAAFGSTGSFEAKYNQLAPAQNLLDAYLETLQQPLHVNRVNDDAPGTSDGSFQLGTVDKAVFIGAWNTPASAKALTIERNNVGVSGTAIGPDTAIGFSALVVDHPASGGTWKFAGPVGDRPNVRYVVVDLRTYVEFFTEPKIYNTGDPILLQVRVRDRGKPVLGANTTVEIALPGQGLGNFLSTTDDSCRKSDPQIPKLSEGRLASSLLARGPSAAGTSAAGTSTPPSAQTGSGDPRPGRYALAAQLLDKCQLQDGKTDLPGSALYDDGTHGDLIAGDGVYSLSFASTLEGSYNFRFHVRGTDSVGTAFSRTSLLSQYVQVAPTPQATTTSLQTGVISGGMQTAYAFFLPRDNLGNYLGPGFAFKYTVTVNGGATIGGVIDLGRGVYGQQVVYSVGGQPPQVIIDGHDPCFRTVVGGSGSPPSTCGSCTVHGSWVLWLLVVLLFIIIVILIVMLRRRRAP